MRADSQKNTFPLAVAAALCFFAAALNSYGSSSAYLISDLRCEPGRSCIPVSPGGQAGRYGGITLPVRFDEDRFYVEFEVKNGEKATFYTDTGGGLFIYRASAVRLGLIDASDKGSGSVRIPDIRMGPSRKDGDGPSTEIFVIEKRDGNAFSNSFDGMLGQAWFAGNVWTFDYPARSLTVWPGARPSSDDRSRHEIKLGFKSNAQGERELNFPRITVGVEGEKLDLLFDTGATTTVTSTTAKAIADGRQPTRAASFIANAVFARWRKEHPEWEVLEKAESGSGEPMIRVPKVSVAGFEVGPVWFTRRQDKNFHEYMSRFMDRRIEGAIGGNVLRHFRVTVDYPRAAAAFELER